MNAADARRLHVIHCRGCDECRRWRDRPHYETVEEWLERMRSISLSPAATPTRKGKG